MTKKDFFIIAKVLKSYSSKGSTVERDEIAYDLAFAMALAYPRFDRRKFLVACGVYDEKEVA